MNALFFIVLCGAMGIFVLLGLGVFGYYIYLILRDILARKGEEDE